MPIGHVTREQTSYDAAVPLRYLKEVPLNPQPEARDLKRTLDELAAENDNLHNQLFAERQQSLSTKCDLEREHERNGELERLLRQALEEKAQCISKLQQHENESRAWIGQRVLLTKACEDLQAKTTKMEEAWRAKDRRWNEARAAYENRIRDLVGRLTEANRQLRLRCSSDFHKRALEDAREQIQRLKQRLRSEQFGRVRDSVLTAEHSGAADAGAQDSIEMLGLKRDNARLTAKVRALEDQLADKNRELNGFRAQLGDVQSLLRDNLDMQSRAAHESKSFGVAIQDLQATIEEQLAEISACQGQIRALDADLQAERAGTAALRAQLEAAIAERDRRAADADALQQRAASADAFKKAIVEIAAERDGLRAGLQRAERARDDHLARADALQSDNGSLRQELQNLVDTVTNHERQLAAQADWYRRWKSDIDSVSGDLRQEADRLRQLRQQEGAEMQSLRRRLAETQDALRQAQEKNARMDSVLDRVIATC